MTRRLIACLILAFILIIPSSLLAQAPPPPPPGSGSDVPPMPPGGPPPPPPDYDVIQQQQPAPDGNRQTSPNGYQQPNQNGGQQSNQTGGQNTNQPQPPTFGPPSTGGNPFGNNGNTARSGNRPTTRPVPPPTSTRTLPRPGSATTAPGGAVTPKPGEPVLPNEDLAPVAAGPGRSWPVFRGDVSHTGATEEQLEFPLKLDWKFITDVTPNNPSSPAVVDGVVYICSGARLYAVNAETGSLKWRYPAEEYLSAQIKSSPVVGQDLVYFGAGDGKLYAIAKDTGNLAWSFATKGIMNSSPILVDGIIYVGSSDDHLYALDAVTGQEKWIGGFRTRDDVASAPAYLDGLVYFISNDMVMYAAHTTTGKIKWQVRVGNWSAASTPVVSDNNVYMASGNILQAFQAKSGRLKWGVKFTNDISTIPAVAGGSAFIATRSGEVYAINNMGKLKWKADMGVPTYGSPIVAGNTVIFGGNKGILAAFDTDTGSLKWKYFVQPSSLDYGKLKYVNLASSPVVSNGTLYVLADDGALHAFRHDAPDTTSPEITPLAPYRDSLIPSAPPTEFAARIFDEGSGLQEPTMQMSVDGQPVEFKFFPDRGIIWYKTEAGATNRGLSDGQHSATVSVYDWAGNKAETTWYFGASSKIRRPPKTASTGTAAAPMTR